MSVTAEPTSESSLFDGLSVHELDATFGLVVDGLGQLAVHDVVARCQRYRGMLDAVEARKLAGIVTADGDTRTASRAAGRGRKTTSREARRRGKRAAAVAKNKALADKMASGDMSGEQVDAIANAAAKSDGAAALDPELIDAVADATADQANQIANDWLAARADADSTQTEHDRQRRLRRANRYTNKDGLGVITFEGDQVTIDSVWAEIRSEANRLYLGDGGRDVAPRDHPRTTSQRLYDALANLVLGTDGGANSRAPQAAGPSADKTRRRPTVVVTVTLDKLVGQAPTDVAHQLGVGPIADTVLAKYLPHAELVGALFSASGQPLWLGRKARHATLGQRLALAVRDRACVLCGADWRTCHAHHLTPWHAPAAGTTDVDAMALVCPRCHHRLHAQNQTLYRHRATGRWRLRAATASETAPVCASRTRPQQQPNPRHTTVQRK